MKSLGDAAQFFASNRNNYQIRTRLYTLSNELSTGRVEDLSQALRADATRLADIDRRLTVGAAQQTTAKSLGGQLSVIQLALGSLDAARGSLSTSLIAVPPEPDDLQIGLAVETGRTAFETMVAGLNERFAGQALFAGTAVDGRALADAEVMLADLSAAIAGAVTAADAAAAIEDWFMQPGGGFETLGYLGETGAAPTRRVDDETSIEISARADDPAIRQLLAATAMAALADDPGMALTARDRADLLGRANGGLISAAAPLVDLQARTGLAERLVEEAEVRLAAQETALTLMRNGMVAADPFETAAELEQVQTQLETHYTVTARLSRLSLVEFLR